MELKPCSGRKRAGIARDGGSRPGRADPEEGHGALQLLVLAPFLWVMGTQEKMLARMMASLGDPRRPAWKWSEKPVELRRWIRASFANR